METKKTTAQIEAEELWIRSKIDEHIAKHGVTECKGLVAINGQTSLKMRGWK